MQVLLVTRRMPASTEALAARDFETRLTPSDVAISDLVAGPRALMQCCAALGMYWMRRPSPLCRPA